MENKIDTEQSATVTAIPELCPRDGSILEAGERTTASGATILTWECPMCTFFKIRK